MVEQVVSDGNRGGSKQQVAASGERAGGRSVGDTQEGSPGPVQPTGNNLLAAATTPTARRQCDIFADALGRLRQRRSHSRTHAHTATTTDDNDDAHAGNTFAGRFWGCTRTQISECLVFWRVVFVYVCCLVTRCSSAAC